MNGEKSQPTKYENLNYELSKRSKGQLLQLFYSEKIFLVMYGTEIDHFHHFLTAFCRVGGHATPTMHHPR
jgi:hypothetical protein